MAGFGAGFGFINRCGKAVVPDLRSIASFTAPGGQEFVAIGPTPVSPWNVQAGKYLGEPGWVRLECRDGERPPTNPGTVNRIGLDGYPTKFPLDQPVHEEFSFVPGPNAKAVASGQWLNFHEIHSTAIAGDVEQVGPLGFYLEWSNGSAANKFRVKRNAPSYTGSNVTGIASSDILNSDNLDMVEGQRYDFVVDFYEHPTAGYVRVWRDGIQIVNYSGPFGYGGGRQNYPQFRIYRAQRVDTAVTFTKISTITVGAP